MYKEFFGLKEYPFSLTPDPRFIVFTPSYNEMLASLYYGIEMSKGLIVLTGEVGTGKSTALRWIIRRLDSSVMAGYIINPHLSIEEFYYHLAATLGIKEWGNKTELLAEMASLLEDRHKKGLHTVLIVDEAHELSDEVLEEIRLLLNYESDDAKHLQIILTGQPELKEKLRRSNLRQLKQRIAIRCEMPNLDSVKEVRRYITERMLIGGAKQPDIFSPYAVDYIYQCSGGIPRLVNNLCDNAMIAAYAAGEEIVSRSMVEEAAANLDLLPDRSTVVASQASNDYPDSAKVLTPAGRNELLIGKRI